MSKRSHSTAFYAEALILIIVFISIILVITNVFGSGLIRSTEAKTLTDSVVLAQNAAEMAAASSDEEELLERLNENGNAAVSSENGDVIEARYNDSLEADNNGKYILGISWEAEKNGNGELVHNSINVRIDGETEPIYSIESAVYVKEERP